LDTIVSIVTDPSGPDNPVIDRKGPLATDKAGLLLQRRYYRDVYGDAGGSRLELMQVA